MSELVQLASSSHLRRQQLNLKLREESANRQYYVIASRQRTDLAIAVSQLV